MTKKTQELIGDKAYDGEPVRSFLALAGIIATIPSKSNRKVKIPHNTRTYKGRHQIENSFVDIKQFRGIATRYCKLGIMYEGMLQLVAWFVGTKPKQRGTARYLL